MKLLNFGSLNLDYVYAVDHIVAPGETIASTALDVFCGGKGLNQSVALARAGAQVLHAGMVGEDGALLLAACRENHIDTSLIATVPVRSGNAIIQVDRSGQNSIVLFGGANRQNNATYIDRVLSGLAPGDWVLLQNEVNLPGEIIARAANKGLRIALNPSPFNDDIASCDMRQVSLFFVNEVEGSQITGESTPAGILLAMRERYPRAAVVLTLGGEGAVYQDAQKRIEQPACKVPVVDTTAAGDTFTGYLLAGLVAGQPVETALADATVAAALAVSRKGATVSIPWREELQASGLRA